MPGVGMGVRGAQDARALSRRIRAAVSGGNLQREMARQLQQAGRPVLVELKAAALAIPATGSGGSTGLRRKIAAATRSAPRATGVRFYVATGMLGGQAALPGLIHEANGWWHPVYGNLPYVHQDRPAIPWFTATIEANEDRLREAVEETLRRVIAMLG